MAFSFPPAHPRRVVEQLRAAPGRGAGPGAAGEVRHVLDQVEEGGLRPLEVVEHDHDRAALGEHLEQPSRGPEDLLLRLARPSRRGRPPPRARPRRAPPCGSPLSCAASASRTVLGRAAARLAGEVAHHLVQRPVGDPLAIRQAAAAQHGRLVPQRGRQLVHEPRLPHTRRAQDRHEVAAATRHGRVERRLERAELLFAAHQRRAERGRTRVSPRGAATRKLPSDPARTPPTPARAGAWRRPRRSRPGSAASCIRRADRGGARRERRAAGLALGYHLVGRHADPRAAAACMRRSSTDARTARRASSSWSSGTPKTAISASPG